MDTKTAGTLEMTAAMVIAGTVGWFVVKTDMPAVSVVFWRCAFGAVAMLAVCLRMGLWRDCGLSTRQGIMAALGGIALTASWTLLFAAYSHASIAIATVTYHTQPFMLVALGALLFGEKLTAQKVGWLGVAFAGVLLVVIGERQSDAHASNYLLGVGLTLAAAFCYAIAAAITKHLKAVPPRVIVLIQMIVGALLLMPFATWPSGESNEHAWGLLLAIGFIHTGLMSTLLYGAIQKISTSLVGVLSFIYPIVAIQVDAWAFGHRLSLAQVAGSVAILAAVAGMNFGWRFSLPRRGRN
jgi:drug/metabolite transporter (DMT)-like permease